MKHYLVVGCAMAALSAPAWARTPEQIAMAALAAAPVWDGHNDVAEQLRARRGDVIADFDFADTTQEPDGRGGVRTMHTDLTRLAKGRVGAQFWSVYVSSTMPEPQAVVATLEQIDVVKRLVARYPERMMLARTAAEVESAMKRGRIASLIGMEGGHSIDGSLGVLRQMFELGVRYMTLTHFKNTAWGDSATDDPAHHGLTDFGKNVVREMQHLGMLVDLSHVSDDTMRSALDVAAAPVIFSHSGARGANGHSRNVPDDVLRRVAANGGIVMVVAYPDYVSEPLRQWNAEYAAEQARQKSLFPGQPEASARALSAWDAAHPAPKSTLSQMADHIDHVRKVAGIDHIGLGGDFDGMRTGPVGMEDVAGYPALFTELARRGYAQADLEKIASRNTMRVLKAVEAYAAAHRRDAPAEVKVAG